MTISEKDMPQEIWCKLTPPDQTGQFWLIERYPVAGATKYTRANGKVEGEKTVKIPTEIAEAKLMALLGTNYLQEHAPHELKSPTTSQPDVEGLIIALDEIRKSGFVSYNGEPPHVIAWKALQAYKDKEGKHDDDEVDAIHA